MTELSEGSSDHIHILRTQFKQNQYLVNLMDDFWIQTPGMTNRVRVEKINISVFSGVIVCCLNLEPYVLQKKPAFG